MTARKIKHARALERREEFFRTVKEGNYEVLRKVQSQREQEQKKQEKERKMEKSKRLAQTHKAKSDKKEKKVESK